uniref:26S proteasome non-ATPase regulatory subunit 2 n=1 Tax=Arcella intermedia TaxID=1963864 RepID=A0A6B2KY04_9EUKA
MDDKPVEEEEEEEILSEEDQKLKQDLELLVERISDVSEDIVNAAIIALKKEIRSSTSSMTSVPKPLKFLQPHYETLKQTYHKMREGDGTKRALADVLSWLGMTLGATTRDCLNFKLLGTEESVSLWGHEYVRHLCAEIGEEYNARTEAEKPIDDLQKVIDESVTFLLSHNAETDACDLLMETERISSLTSFVGETNYKRVCLYMESCAHYLTEPDDTQALRTVMNIYDKMNKTPEAIRLALALSDKEFIEQTWNSTEDPVMKRQLAFMLASHGHYHLIEECQDEDLQELMGNVRRSRYFQILAKDLDILEPKLPEDIYKNLTENVKAQRAKQDSARQNLASTFVNAFVNAGFVKDKLMNAGDVDWLGRNREHGRLSTVASVGLICLWDTEEGPNEVVKYNTLEEDNLKAGLALGHGIVNCNVRTAFDIGFSVISEHLSHKSQLVKQCAALGLGLAYAGSSHEQSCEALLPIYEDAAMELLGHVALALGMIKVGTCDPVIAELFLMTLMDRGEAGLKSTFTRYLCLGLGLLYLGKQEAAEVTLETLKTIPGVWGKYACLTVETCAYCGTGNVLKIQSLLAVCGEHLEEADNGHQAVAVLGIALIALREEIGRDMVVRSFDHLLQYGEVNIRRAVPLALGILSICNPDLSIMDTLSKFSHDNDAETAMGAIFGLGLIGAGTNNSRIAQLLRGLATYHAKDPNLLFVVRISQGILHMGKGTMSINPYHSNGLLMRPAAMAGLLATIHSCFDFKNIILLKSHYFLYTLVLAMFPRMLMTFNENMEPLSVAVRVGQAVDVIGKAGNPKAITGFQTHNTPVLLGVGDRAELATDEYISVSPILEGCVILKPNPDFKKTKKQ